MMEQTSVIEIDKDAYTNNLAFIRKMISKNTRLSVVVKGNAYGHGINIFVPIALENGIDHFSVFSSHEARRVFDITQKTASIMIMGHVNDEDIAWAIRHDVEFFVFHMDRLEKAAKIAHGLGKRAIIHIELETGMNRTGFKPHEMPEVLDLLRAESDNLRFRGLCTHLAGAESIANYYRINRQKRLYRQILKKCAEAGLEPEQRHVNCSAGMIRYPEVNYDMVRVGIMQYGFWPSQEILIEWLSGRKRRYNPLKRLISWKTWVMAIKTVKTGEYIGYGTTYLSQHDMTIAILPVGYAYGFGRSLSNQGRVIVGGKRVPVIGMVNMNCIAIDVTEVEELNIYDEVLLVGRDGDVEISVSSFSELSNQVNYEMLTRLPKDIPRKITANGFH